MYLLGRRHLWSGLAGMMIFAGAAPCTQAAVAGAGGVAQFHQQVEPLLEQYCYDCHGDGAAKGNVAFDELTNAPAILNPDLWSKVLVNLRAGIMPPQKKARPTAAEQKQIEDWIKFQAFGIDPLNPDPGRVTLRRLNRNEYRNTIRDLLGVDYNTEVEFPPDDTGYGFDDIGDVLTVSPLLLEKYMTAATTIVGEAVPKVSAVMPEVVIPGRAFRESDEMEDAGDEDGAGHFAPLGLSYYDPGSGSHTYVAKYPGTYRLAVELSVRGTFEFDPGKCRVIFKLDGQELLNREFTWEDNKTFPPFNFDEKWQPGPHQMSIELQPLTSKDDQENPLEMRLDSVTIQGPFETQYWTQPKHYARFFPHPPPEGAAARRQYAHEVLGHFAAKAFRRPPDAATVERLAALAESVYTQPGETFETGVAQAMVALLSSPRFLFHSEAADPATAKDAYPLIDEYSLASRLSYFLWSTMPDDELFGLAARGELRKNLPAQVKRMLADPRSEALVDNFTGQWLQVRDVEGMTIDTRTVLARDKGEEKQLKEQLAAQRARFEALFAAAAQAKATNALAAKVTGTNGPSGTNQLAQGNGQRRGPRGPRFARPPNILDADAKHAMERETQMVFASIMHEDRSVLELLDSNYTFLNEKLAGIYGLTNLGINGQDMRRVTLPPGSPRGGVLTEGTVLVVTSNPDRTSPVKRGLFVLSHILGSPPPPPPPNVPALEAAENNFHDHEPTLRETLKAHRDRPECFACHSRLDPMGLAFENFNALGMWREQERHQQIDASGQLISGETFQTVQELKQLLTTHHRREFYSCLTGKLLTYATGRGMEYYDTETVDRIVQQLDDGNGRFSVLLAGIINSAPFQKERRQPNAVFTETADAAPNHSSPELTSNPVTP